MKNLDLENLDLEPHDREVKISISSRKLKKVSRRSVIQMSVVLKFFTELPWRKKISNGVVFTHPSIFRRFLADISETVPLRQKLKKVIFKTIIPSNFPLEH